MVERLDRVPFVEMEDVKLPGLVSLPELAYHSLTHVIAVLHGICARRLAVMVLNPFRVWSGIEPRVKKCSSCYFTRVSARLVAAFARPPTRSAYIDSQQKNTILSDSIPHPGHSNNGWG